MPNGRCRFHGGKSLSGVASPVFKSGKYSQYMPPRLLERYGEALTDPDLLALSEEIAAVDALIIDALGRMDTRESGVLWRAANKKLVAMEAALRRDDQGQANMLFRELGGIIRGGQDHFKVVDEVRALFQDRRRLVESERKRRVEEQLSLTIEEAMNLFTAMVTAVKEYVDDRAKLALIQAEFNRLTASERANSFTIDAPRDDPHSLH